MADVTEIDWTTTPPTVVERDFTPEELEQIQKDKIESEEYVARMFAERAEAEAKRAELLNRLGITEEEAKLLLS